MPCCYALTRTGVCGGGSAMHQLITGEIARSSGSCSTPKKPATRSNLRVEWSGSFSWNGTLEEPEGKLLVPTPYALRAGNVIGNVPLPLKKSETIFFNESQVLKMITCPYCKGRFLMPKTSASVVKPFNMETALTAMKANWQRMNAKQRKDTAKALAGIAIVVVVVVAFLGHALLGHGHAYKEGYESATDFVHEMSRISGMAGNGFSAKE